MRVQPVRLLLAALLIVAAAGFTAAPNAAQVEVSTPDSTHRQLSRPRPAPRPDTTADPEPEQKRWHEDLLGFLDFIVAVTVGVFSSAFCSIFGWFGIYLCVA